MARARNIKPGFFRNADLVELPFSTRLLFAGLWTLADRAGRLEDRPRQIKMDIFPADDVDCDAALSELAQAGMLERYEVGGRAYLQITKFLKHQNPHMREALSTIPAPPGTAGQEGSLPDDARPVAPTPSPAPVAANAGLPDAGKALALSEHSAGTGAARLNPDSPILNPDSPTLNPGHAAVDDSTPAMARAVCVVLRAENIEQPNPVDPELQVLVAHGADPALFRAAAKTAVASGNPRFAYVLGIVKRKMQQAAAMAATALALPVATMPAQVHAMRVDMSRATVPGRDGPDPELQRIERERANFTGMPADFRAKHLGGARAAVPAAS